MGTYLGRTDPPSRRSYQESAALALAGGVNVLDTASNYRDQASERDLGTALQAFVGAGGDRNAIFVATKAGFLHGDCEADQAWTQREYGGILEAADVVEGHSLAPAFITHELHRSRRNLGLSTLDCVFLHNVEHPLQCGVPEAEFYARVEAAFEALERAVDQGEIRMYGVATWNGFRVPPSAQGHLSLVKLVHHAGAARMKAGGRAGDHHFRAIELPVNLAMTEAALVPTQPFRFGAKTILECATDLGMVVLASASLMQMRIAGQVPAELKEAFGTEGDADTALQFTRSVPGVTTALVGMGRPEHAKANTEFAARTAPAPSVAKTILGTGSVHGW